MTTKPLRSLASGGLFLIIALWLAVFCFASGSPFKPFLSTKAQRAKHPAGRILPLNSG